MLHPKDHPTLRTTGRMRFTSSSSGGSRFRCRFYSSPQARRREIAAGFAFRLGEKHFLRRGVNTFRTFASVGLHRTGPNVQFLSGIRVPSLARLQAISARGFPDRRRQVSRLNRSIRSFFAGFSPSAVAGRSSASAVNSLIRLSIARDRLASTFSSATSSVFSAFASPLPSPRRSSSIRVSLLNVIARHAVGRQ